MGTGNTKLNTAFKMYGFINFKYNVIDTTKYGNIRELWALEDTYIHKFDSISNGYNSRFNIKNNLP